MRKLVKEQMGKRLLNLVDELATSYGQGTYAHSNIGNHIFNSMLFLVLMLACVCIVDIEKIKATFLFYKYFISYKHIYYYPYHYS
jgi:hypothetical protein